jgi:hypothetical protein
MYFGRIKKYFPSIKNNYIMCDIKIPYDSCFLYNDSEPYSKQMIDVLNQIPTNYVIYSQEDYILFDYVKEDNIQKYIDVLDNDKKINFIRLIQSGLNNHFEIYNEDLIVIDPNIKYYFSTQITIWRKEVLKLMFELSQVQSIFDEPKNSSYLKQLGGLGLVPINKGNKVGGHYNSYDYPYIATAKVKGKWNINEYPDELKELFKEYDIKF